LIHPTDIRDSAIKHNLYLLRRKKSWLEQGGGGAAAAAVETA